MSRYSQSRELKNPYTLQPFSKEELDDICLHEQAPELLKLVAENHQKLPMNSSSKELEDYLYQKSIRKCAELTI